MKKTIAKYYALLPVLLLCVFYTWKAIDFPVHDFANYYFGGKFFAASHFGSWIYFPYEFNKAIFDSGCNNIFASYAPNSPFLALLFVPFSLLSVALSKILFNCISVLLLIFSLKRLTDFYKIPSIVLLLLPVLFFAPIKNGLLFGQVYFLLFFLLSESWLAYQKKQFLKMALFLAFSIVLKIFPALLILAFLFKKEFRPAVYVMGFIVFLLGFTAIFSGFDVWIFYLKDVLPKASNGEISTAFVPNYQSVLMFLKQLLVFDSNENQHPIANAPELFSALLIGFKMFLIAVGFYVSRKANNALFVLSFWILAMLLISPYGSTYGFILLIFPFFALVKSPLSNFYKAIGMVLLFVISNIPMALLLPLKFPFSFLRLFALILFLIIFLRWFYQYINLKILVIVTIIPMAIFYFVPKTEIVKGIGVLSNGPILIYDYKIEDQNLTYFYWNEKGANSATIPFKIAVLKAAFLKQNQVFLNQNLLTFDRTNKLKPTALSDHSVIFLSDANRGIGFYTLRIVGENKIGDE